MRRLAGVCQASLAMVLTLPYTRIMGVVAKRLFGLVLLVLAIGIPSCQAVFPRRAAEAPRPVAHELLPR